MAEANVNIAINAVSNTKRAFNKTASRFDNLKSKIRENEQAFQAMAIGGTAAFAAIGAGVLKTVDEASKAQEIERTFSAVFDETEGRMRRWTQEFSERFGRVDSQMQKMAATSAGVLVPAFDLSEQKIAKLTRGLGESAVALAAYDPRIDNAQQAMEGFTQALIGNRQRILDWGFQVREAQLKAEALEKGIIEQGESLTQQQEAMLTAQKIMGNTEIAQDVLRKSQQDWSEQTKRLNSRFVALQQTIGEVFLEDGTSIVKQIREAIDATKNWVEANEDATKSMTLFGGATAGIIGVSGALGTLAAIALTTAGILSAKIGAAISVFTVAFFGAREAINSTFEEFSKLPGIIQGVVGIVMGGVKTIQGIIEVAAGVIQGVFTGNFQLIKQGANSLLEGLKNIFQGLLTFFRSIGEMITPILSLPFRVAFNFIVNNIVTPVTNKIKILWRSFWNAIQTIVIKPLKQIFNFIQKWFLQKPLNAVKKTWGQIKSVFSNAWSGIINVLKNSVETALDVLDPLLDAVNKIGGFASSIGSRIQSGISNIGSAIGVDDAIIKPNGQVIRTHPDDTIFATKNPGARGGGIVVNINGGNFGSDAGEEIGDQIIERLKNEQRI